MIALPICIPVLPSMDNDRLYTFFVYNPELKIERNQKGELLIMAPTGVETGKSINAGMYGKWVSSGEAIRSV